MSTKRHSPSEISAKLRQADELAAKGKLQTEIAEILGVSIMTYHRWKKGRAHADPLPHDVTAEEDAEAPPEAAARRIAKLHLEKSRLRGLVTDLLLEKLELEELLRKRTSGRNRSQG